MSLAFRLALALVIVAVGATAMWGLAVRRTSQRILEAEFDARIESATVEVREALVSEATQLRDLTLPLCKRGTFFDRALTDYERAKGDLAVLQQETGAQLALRHQVPDEAVARSFDELALVTTDGTILSSSNRPSVGRRDERLGRLIRSSAEGAPQLRPAAAGGEPSIEVWCARTVHEYTLGLVAARKIAAILDRVGRAHGVTLEPIDPEGDAPPSTARKAVRVMRLPEVPGLAVVATLPRDRLVDALAELDREIFASGGLAALAALLIAVVLGRSLAKPLRELAHETREVVSGEPRPVRVRGGLEIRELARSFNKTIDELGRMKKRLAVTERIAARREIARQVAHEIKNPLAPIRAAVETLRRLRERGDERFDDYFDEATRTVLEEVHRIANIVSEFTKFQRLPAPNPEPMDLVVAARGVVSLHAADPEQVRTGGGDAEPRVELLAENEVPQVRADKDQIVQVLTNLVQNGLEAAAAVRPDPRVTVTVGRVDDAHVRVVVRDNGPGVSDEMRERLFEAYATSKPTGTGLGLAICQRIVFEHGGEIAYRPATKGGAVFEIRLPINGPTLLAKPLETTAQPVSRAVDSSRPGAGS
ncbi:MAG: HAMP domain-containing protein [Polyangiaceae bacterium]|jgi:two-component system nitrogen regulation sensor histidine kinase NtrY|nr:HAMP domain-containing protein [Polyangiaceae bacterium]